MLNDKPYKKMLIESMHMGPNPMRDREVNINRCPLCLGEAVSRCKIGERKCANGHSWYREGDGVIIGTAHGKKKINELYAPNPRSIREANEEVVLDTKQGDDNLSVTLSSVTVDSKTSYRVFTKMDGEVKSDKHFSDQQVARDEFNKIYNEF